MEYKGYYNREQIAEIIEKEFPLIDKPKNEMLFLFGEEDIMTRILEPKLSIYEDAELDAAGVLILYDEFSSITNRAVQWLFPSLLRVLVSKRDPSGNLHWNFPFYFENINLEDSRSAYNFSWLNNEQIRCVCLVLEHLSEEYDDVDSIASAQEQLLELRN